LVAAPTGVGEEPSGGAVELGPTHPAVRLRIEQVLLDVHLIEAPASGDPAAVGEPEQEDAVQHQQLGLRHVRQQSPATAVTRPVAPSTRTRCPSDSAVRAPAAPTTAGMPASRATIAAWQSIPPTSVTTAAA